MESVDVASNFSYNASTFIPINVMAKKQKTAEAMRSKTRWGVFGVFALLALTTLYIVPAQANQVIRKINEVTAIGIPEMSAEPFSLGLDLQGGAHLVYHADVTGIAGVDQRASVEGVRDVIERRVNNFGVGEPSIQTTKVGEEYRIIVELPGVTDVNEAIAQIGETPILEFHEENNEPPRAPTKEELARYTSGIEAARERTLPVIEAFSNGESFENIVRDYSEDSVTRANGGSLGFIERNDNTEVIYEWADQAEIGTFSAEPLQLSDGFYFPRLDGEQPGSTQVEASHILICYLGAVGCDSPMLTKEEAEAFATNLLTELTPENFAQKALQHSTDPTVSADNGGSLGYFSRETMVPAFATAAYAAQVGEIVGPVETQFGYHLIYKTDERTPIQYSISATIIAFESMREILPSQDPFIATGLSGSHLERAEVVTDPQTGSVQVALQFDNEGKQLFREITERNLNKPVAILLDGQIISAPTVQNVITDGRAVVSGNFNIQEARLLSQRLNAGALPVPIDLISQQSIGASLGQESLAKSLRSGLIALLLVMIFMIVYYRLPGVLAIIALSLYITVTLALFKFIGVTLSLAGIAGLILSIGMAVDANVLIFERLKEELQDGKSLKRAVEEGFLRAWTSIRDGNVSTLITCVLLIWFGTSFVKGFATTLALGILVSMFSAVIATRVLLRLVIPWVGEKANILFLGARK